MASTSDSQLILDLDSALRRVLQQSTSENVRSCFSLIQQCHHRRLADEKIVRDDHLYIPAILLLRQFDRFQTPSAFDELLQQFISLFQLIPISTKKILDDLLCVISIILTKRIMTSHDEVQQDLFVRFFRAFILSVKQNVKLFYGEFLGNFNQNLPIVGHYLSCLLQLFEKIHALDLRLNIIDALWSMIYIEKNEHRGIIGQILACFLPGLLKTLVQDLGSVHQRLVQANLHLLSYVLRMSVDLSPKSSPTNEELRDIMVERNEPWFLIVDAHVAPLLERLSTDYVNHESLIVRRGLAVLMLTVLHFTSTRLKFSAKIALKTMLILVSWQHVDANEMKPFRVILEKLFKCNHDTLILPSVLTYEDEFIHELANISDLTLSDHLLVECQTDLFQLLDQAQTPSSTFADRRWRLQLFIGYYTFIHRRVDFLFDLEAFTEKFLRFIFNTLDFETLIRDNRVLLNEISSKATFDEPRYQSIYKYLQPDVYDEIKHLMQLFLSSHGVFTDYLFEQIARTKAIENSHQKILFLLSVIYETTPFERAEDYQQLLALLTQRRRRKGAIRAEDSISTRNVTLYFLFRCLRTITAPHQTEYLIDYVPLLLLSHASEYTLIHQTALCCLHALSSDLGAFLVSQSEYVVDSSLRRLQTSSLDGYLILIELVRLGQMKVINLPIMVHVIEQLLLELSCLPAMDCIQLTFEFLTIFCQQVVDIVDDEKPPALPHPHSSVSLIEFILDLQRQYTPSTDPPVETNGEENEEKKTEHAWHKMLVSIVDVFQHFISHSNSQIRAYVLDAFPSLARLLSTIDENLFLPLVHKLWPGFLHRLHDDDYNIRGRCLTIIRCLCELCSEFVDRRIRQDVLPILMQQLDSHRLLPSINTLEYRYMKSLLTQIGSILHSITIDFDDMEKIALILFQYLQVELLAPIAYEQLVILARKSSDILWLTLILHDAEHHRAYFQSMKVYQPQPRLAIDSKWKSNLITCLTQC